MTIDPDLIMNGQHPCVTPDCNLIAEYDDEPHCYTHSPDSGSSVPGYSYRAQHGTVKS
jgi:hypothetical protein